MGKDSVLYLRITKAIYNLKRPYHSFTEKNITGSGFIIDITRGLVLTTAKNVSSAISIVGRSPKTGKKDLSLEVIGICREKDLAICKIHDVELLKQTSNNLDAKFADSLNLKSGEKSFIVNYHEDFLNVKPCYISGYKKIDHDKREDSYTRNPTFIQLDTKIVSGEAGSPLLNNKEEVIGILASHKLSNECSLAIPSRTFLAIYSELIKSSNFKMPTLSLDWCNTNREIMKKQTGSSSTYGIFVRKVYKDSCLDELQKGDIIRRIDFVDVFNKPNGEINKSALNLKELEKLTEEKEKKENIVTVFFDRFGVSVKTVKLKNLFEKDESKFEFEAVFTDRKMELSEVMDMIPVGAEMYLNMCREKNWYLLKTNYVHIPSERISWITDKPNYEIFAGICVSDLSMDHVKKFNLKIENQYQKQVIIVHIFPETSVYKSEILSEGSIIKSIIGFNSELEPIKDTYRAISSLEDIRHILHLRPSQIQITTHDDFVFLISLDNMIKEDKQIFKTYKIAHKYILE